MNNCSLWANVLSISDLFAGRVHLTGYLTPVDDDFFEGSDEEQDSEEMSSDEVSDEGLSSMRLLVNVVVVVTWNVLIMFFTRIALYNNDRYTFRRSSKASWNEQQQKKCFWWVKFHIGSFIWHTTCDEPFEYKWYISQLQSNHLGKTDWRSYMLFIILSRFILFVCP